MQDVKRAAIESFGAVAPFTICQIKRLVFATDKAQMLFIKKMIPTEKFNLVLYISVDHVCLLLIFWGARSCSIFDQIQKRMYKLDILTPNDWK